MANHADLTGSDLHESKGVSTATAGQVDIADGAGSQAWTSPTLAAMAPEVLATATEVNQACDVSTRLIAAGSTLSVTGATHGAKIIKLDTATGSVCTLPAASGTGQIFRFVVSALATSNSHIVKVANASDIMQGTILTVDTDTAGTVTGWGTAVDSDTITLNRTTTGSVLRGEYIELLDLATNLWAVKGTLSNTASGATPFSATV